MPPRAPIEAKGGETIGTITVTLQAQGSEAQAIALKAAIAALPSLPGGATVTVGYSSAV